MNIRNFDLNLLIIFQDLCKTSSVSQTALNLGLSQPAVSHALNRLRESLGDELFTRSKRKLIPTARALELAPAVSRAIDNLSLTLFSGNEWSEKVSTKTFVLSGTSYDASIVFPGLVGLMQDKAPHLKFQFKGIVLEKYLERMIHGEVDLSFAGNFPGATNFQVETLGEWDFCLVAASSSKKYKKNMSLEQYLRANHILYVPTERSGSEVDTLLSDMGKKRNISIETSYLEAIPNLLIARDYLTMLPRFYANKMKKHYPIRIMEPPFSVKPFKHQMVWHKSKDNLKEHIWLREFIRSNYKKIMKVIT